MRILVTGGAGYIGSHTCIELLNKGYEIIVVDNFINSKMEALNRVKEITNKDFKIYNIDMCDYKNFEKIFINEKIDGVIHFAGLKAVGESVTIPLKYYQNNLISTLNLIEFMKKYNVNNLVFSSSATVYGDPEIVPIPETANLNATNPYGRTKLMIEDILRDFSLANKDFNVALLRYFNPIGAHKSGKIGEDPNGIPNNLLPYISQVAIGKLKKLRVFGNDYDTIDGTGVRDYIHVVDLALGHIKAIEKLITNPGLVTYNLGTGNGTSVLEMIKSFEKASGIKIDYEIVNRRPGDIASCYADPTKAKIDLNWEAHYNIDDMCRDTWNWQKNNPNGYN
ncbi:UDP-galactose 4-epimerase [Hypnocyclicus thermotrophus]|uniref:UDP-glucose 4-epimerase n=1 Tax=Hypnocyclicus thermotrophus TaxID=1627895 RepID=A0AA46DYS4_9FUSO|nr:UDP-glucose 4-epimerase GalE [Hypnocyclicus thermotrophus]TDT70609.1 UDP-galactose 4-epimerase [Hypnocyclicus thermotrophus]